MFLKEGQYSPNHFHWFKTEDIINRGGGNVLIRVYNSKEDASIDYETDVTVHTDGRTYTVPAGTQIRLTRARAFSSISGCITILPSSPVPATCCSARSASATTTIRTTASTHPWGDFPRSKRTNRRTGFCAASTQQQSNKKGRDIYVDVVALGELLIDFAAKSKDPDGYPTMAANPGGAPGNFLAALNVYSKKTAFLGKVGDDAFGQLLLGTLQRAGIDTRGVLADPDYFTTLAFVTFNDAGDRSFSFARKPGADTQLCWEEVDQSLIDEARVFHFGTLSLTDEPARTATRKAASYAKQTGKLISCDPNLRVPLWRSKEEAREQMLWSLQQADVVKISDNEVSFLWACSPEEGAEKLLREFDVKLAMVTLGAGGLPAADKERMLPRARPKGPSCGHNRRGRYLWRQRGGPLSGSGESPGRAHAGRPFLYRNLRTHGREPFYRALRRYSEHPEKKEMVLSKL